MFLRLEYIIFLLYISQILACAKRQFIKKHQCLEHEGQICTLEEVPKLFIPVSHTPFSVVEVIITGSILPVLNRSICQAFPNTEKFNAGGQKIQEVDPDTFTLCTRLRHIFLGANEIQSLAPSTFKQNKFISHLWLYMNELEELEPELFINQKYLEYLYLSSNSLKSFAPEVFKPLRNLKFLSLHNNNLEDLDVPELLNTMPYLREIQIRFNPFDCKKLKGMLRLLEERNIWLGKNGGDKDKYEYAYVKGFECAKKLIYKKIYVKVCGHVLQSGPNVGKRKCVIQERIISETP